MDIFELNAELMRKDFESTCECGYYLCPECGEPHYPMEVLDSAADDDPPGTYRCMECSAVITENDFRKECI